MSAQIAADGSQGSNTIPVNNVTRAELVNWVQNAQEKAGFAKRQLDDLLTTGPLTVLTGTAGAKVYSTKPADAAAGIEDFASLAGAGAVSVTKRRTRLTAGSGAFPLTLPSGQWDGQEAFVEVANPATTATWTATGLANLHGFTGFVMSAASHSLFLKWDLASGLWRVYGGNCQLS